MSYLKGLQVLRDKMSAASQGVVEQKTDSLIPMRQEQTSNPDTTELVDRAAQWLREVKQASAEISQKTAPKEKSGGFAEGFQSTLRLSRNDEEAEERKNSFIERRAESSPSTYAPKRPGEEAAEGKPLVLKEASNKASPGYGDITQKDIESIIQQEASLRGMDPKVAVAIFRSEGAGNYQSQIKRSGKGVHNGKEASFGPYQLFTGGGLGNQYQKETGRDLLQDNTIDGITNQIRFSLDAAVDQGWTPWYGRKHAGVGVRDGLSGAKKVGNWK